MIIPGSFLGTKLSKVCYQNQFYVQLSEHLDFFS